MPSVSVRLYAGLRKYGGGADPVVVEITPGESVKAVLQRVGVPDSLAQIVFVNHRRADLQFALQGAEQLAVFPAVGGG